VARPQLFRTFAIVALALTGLLSGCKKKQSPPRLNSSQVRAITREMLRTLSAAVPPNARVESKLEFDAGHLGRADHIRITSSAEGTPEFMDSTAERLTQALDAIAAAHSLTASAKSPSLSSWRLEYRYAGILTHVVEINAAAAQSNARPATARLAIILDDLGNDRDAADAIFALPYPVTISVLPDHQHSAEIAEDAHRHGFGVMLHLPMQPIGSEKPEPHELRPGMSQTDVTALFDQLVATVPHVIGVNNHQGSQSTADAVLMNELMPVLRQHHLFYIDSRTTAATVAYESAQRAGVRAAFRNAPFIDDVVEVGAVRKQLRLALRDAQKKGEVIAIGHPHPATLAALRELAPQAESSGVKLVSAADLVH